MTSGSPAGRRLFVALIALCVVQVAAPMAATAPRVLWQLALPARGIPAHDAVSAYFLTHDHELVAASLVSGRVRWRLRLDRTAPTFGSRVIVHGDTVVAGDYDLAGVDRRTGRRRWAFAAVDGGGAAMHLGEMAGDVVLSGSLAGVMRAIAIADGRPRWTTAVGPAATTTVYEPVVAGRLAAAAFADFGAASAGLAVVDVRTGRKRWQRVLPGSAGPSGHPVFADDAVFVSDRAGLIHAFDAATGASRATLDGRSTDGQDYRPLAAAGRMVVAGSLSGEVVAWDVKSGRQVWRRQPSLASVAFTLSAKGGVVFVPYMSGHLVALRLGDGRELWRLGGGPTTYRWLPAVDRNLLLASGSDVISLFRYGGGVQTWR